MKGVTSDVAAREIRNACRSKFSTSTPASEEEKRKFDESWNGRPLTGVELNNIRQMEYNFSEGSGYFHGILIKMNNQNPNEGIRSLKYRYKFTSGGEWSLVYEWTYTGKYSQFGPLKTVESLLENTGDRIKVKNHFRKKGAGIVVEILEGKTCGAGCF